MKKRTFNIQNILRDNIKTIQSYSSARDEFTDAASGMVFLDANENPFESGVNRYPDPQQKSVKQQLSLLKEVPIDQIFLGNGSDEVLDLIMRAFCEPNKDNVIILPPTYGMYKVLANINAIDVKEVVLTTNFEPKTQTILLAANEDSKVLFLCSPNNPTGNTFSSIQVEKLLNQFRGIVVVDEAYIDFSEKDSWLKRLSEFPNLVITQTLSKAYGVAGIRLGTCYASKEIVKVLNSIKPPYNVNELTQQKASERLSKPAKIAAEIEEINTQKKGLKKQLSQINFIETVYDSDANFLLIKVDDANKRYAQLIEKAIVVRNRSNEPLCDNCLRISVGTGKENEKLIEVLSNLGVQDSNKGISIKNKQPLRTRN